MKVLNLGCGRRDLRGLAEAGTEWITLDADPLVEPDIVCNLGKEHIPLPDNSIDTAIAIHVLEHIGRQGDTAEWFAFWEDLYRVLIPGGSVEFESPIYSSVWAWADPAHVRALSAESFIFFAQDNYRIKDSAISPFRIKCDFVPTAFEMGSTKDSFRGELRAVKPLRVWWEDAAPLLVS
jgi:SAM-dependent methyltransferase